MNKIKEILSNKIYWICLIISMCFFGVFAIPEYATDTYSIIASDWTYAFYHFMSLGRYITAIFWAILMGILNLSFNSSYFISYIIGILCFSISLYKMYKIIRFDMKNKILAVITAILIIINIFSLELFMYFEKSILALSILLNVLAIEKLIKFFEGNKKSLIYVFIYMLLANSAYQGTVALFVSLGVIYILKYSKNIKEFIKNNIIVALLYAIPALINLISIKIFFATERLGSKAGIVNSIIDIIQNLPNILISTHGIIPKYLFFIFICLILLVYIIRCIREKLDVKIILLNILKYAYVGLAIIFATVAPQALQNEVYMVPRDTYAAASMAGIFILCMSVFNKNENTKIYDNILIGISVIFIFIQYINFQNITIDHYRMNYMDSQIATQIAEEITNYEKETGLKIEKIVCYQDKDPAWQYGGLRVIGDANTRAFYPEWSRVNIIKMKLNRYDIESSQNENQEYVDKFKQESWSYYSNEQLIFDGNVLHLCCF